MSEKKRKRDQSQFEDFGIPHDGGQFTLEPPHLEGMAWTWQAVHQSEKILDALPVGICLVLEGEVIYANRLLAKTVVGARSSTAAQRPFLNLVAPRRRQLVEDRFRTALATSCSVPVPDTVVKCADGTLAHAYMVIEPITFEGHKAAVVTISVLDGLPSVATADHRAGKAPHEGYSPEEVRHLLDRIDELTQECTDLERKSELLRAIANEAQDLIFSKDTNLRYTFVNPAMERLHRRSASEFLGMLAEDVMSREASSRIKSGDARVLEGETVEEIYTTPINQIQHTFHGIRAPLKDHEGRVVGLFGIVRNITEPNHSHTAEPSPTKRTFRSKAMRETLHQAQSIAASDGTVLLLGESGSGKDYLARWIHENSRRSDGRFFSVNCAAFSGELADSELFGHEAGAFTGARTAKKGVLQLAEGGTLLLNEIGEFSLPLQAKLLTFLDTKSFLKVGGEQLVHVNVRIMAATHRMLMKEVAEGRFLSALFYRLNVLRIDVPPLRDRVEDIPLIAGEIISRLAREMQLQQIPELDAHSLSALANYHWPGNVRELRNVLERALMLWKGGSLHIDTSFQESTPEVWSHNVNFDSEKSLPDVLGDVAKAMCHESMRRCNGNKTEAARLLGISRGALYRSMKRSGRSRDFGT